MRLLFHTRTQAEIQVHYLFPHFLQDFSWSHWSWDWSMGSPAASCTLLCPVYPLQPTATPIWQQQGQKGDTSAGTDTGDQKTAPECSGQYQGGSSWVMSRREEEGQVKDGSEQSHCCLLGSPCQDAPQHPLPRSGATCKSQLPLGSLVTCLNRIPSAK